MKDHVTTKVLLSLDVQLMEKKSANSGPSLNMQTKVCPIMDASPKTFTSSDSGRQIT